MGGGGEGWICYEMIQSLSTTVTRLCSLNQTRKRRCKSSFEFRVVDLHVGEKLDSLAGIVFRGEWEFLIVIIAFRFFETLEEFDIVNAFRYLRVSLFFEHTFRVPGAIC